MFRKMVEDLKDLDKPLKDKVEYWRKEFCENHAV